MNPLWVFELRYIGNLSVSIPNWVSAVEDYKSLRKKRRGMPGIARNFSHLRKALVTDSREVSHMETGIGFLIEIEMLVTWEKECYPAQHRRGGAIFTPAGEVIPFVTDKPIPEKEVKRAVGRRTNQIVEVADFITESKT